MAVEEYGRPRLEVLQEGQPRTQLVNKEGIGPEGGELAISIYGDEEVELAQDGAEDAETREDGGRDDGVAPDADVEGA